MLRYSATSYNGQHFNGERNDCAVRAYMTTTGCTYAEAHAVMRTRCQRPDRRGTPTHLLIRLLESDSRFERVHSSTVGMGFTGRGYGYGRVRSGTVSLARFIADNPRGTFYVLKASHAFAVVDGVVVDTWKPGPRCKVTHAWKLKGTGSAPVVAPKPAPVVAPTPKAAPAPVQRPQGGPVATVTPSGKARIPTAMLDVLRAEGAGLSVLTDETVRRAYTAVLGAHVVAVMSDRQVAWATSHVRAGFKAR